MGEDLVTDRTTMRARTTRDRDCVTGADELNEFTDERKHDLILLAERIVAMVRAQKVRGGERCFLNDQVQLLLRD